MKNISRKMMWDYTLIDGFIPKSYLLVINSPCLPSETFKIKGNLSKKPKIKL